MTKSVKDDISLPMAVDRLIHALREDEGYFMGWQANIAVQFQDECARFKAESDKNYLSANDIHGVSNRAAINFLNLLIKTGDPAEETEEPLDPNANDEKWETAAAVPVNPDIERVILQDNGGSMDEVIANAEPFPEDESIVGKSAHDVFPDLFNNEDSADTPSDLPEIDPDNEDYDLSELVKDREDQDEIKVDPEDL